MREQWLFYEEYSTPADKRRAQRAGAKYGKPTGKANAYVAALHGQSINGSYDAIGALYDTKPGEVSPVCGTSAPYEYLRTRCRRVGKWDLPPEWRAMFANYFPELKVKA